jgi:c-di-GMP-binding flagellar brake protein YcgR
MGYKDLSGFQIVSFKSERENALKDLGTRHPWLTAATADNATFLYQVAQITGSRIYLKALEETRAAKVGEELKLIFSLTTGQYALVAIVETSASAGSIVIDFAKSELMRLQRRDSFRIVVPPSIGLEFYLNGKIKPEYALKVADVSLGGAALRLNPEQISKYWVNSSIKGSLVLHGREPIELEGTIKHHFPKDQSPTQKVGVQFLNLSIDQQRELLSLTLQLHREMNPKP